MPLVPEIPDVPATPLIPLVPLIPEVPDTPLIPLVPDVPLPPPFNAYEAVNAYDAEPSVFAGVSSDVSYHNLPSNFILGSFESATVKFSAKLDVIGYVEPVFNDAPLFPPFNAYEAVNAYDAEPRVFAGVSSDISYHNLPSNFILGSFESATNKLYEYEDVSDKSTFKACEDVSEYDAVTAQLDVIKYNDPVDKEAIPEVPLVPPNPSIPEVPDIPDVPSVPLIPLVPEVPLIPFVPFTPEVPLIPLVH